MCLAIPGRITEIVDAEDAQVGHRVLIHVGFALSRIVEKEARNADAAADDEFGAR